MSGDDCRNTGILVEGGFPRSRSSRFITTSPCHNIKSWIPPMYRSDVEDVVVSETRKNIIVDFKVGIVIVLVGMF